MPTKRCFICGAKEQDSKCTNTDCPRCPKENTSENAGV